MGNVIIYSGGFMKVLLDTNILIHRETSRIINDDIGSLFFWLDKLHYQKCVHPISKEEINKYQDSEVVRAFNIKLDNYYLLKTVAPIHASVQRIITNFDKNENDRNDSKIINELLSNRIDIIISEDRGLHKKGETLGLTARIFTIDSFLEKVTYENPELITYKVLSVKKSYFGHINIADSFFESFKKDYVGFEEWFNRKSEEIAYVCEEDDKILAFLYIKKEGRDENYTDIVPPLIPKARLKIGTFKVIQNGFKLGERFLKIIFDNAIQMHVDEIYVTIFNNNLEQQRLIKLLEEWGFMLHGYKTSESGKEEVYVRNFVKKYDTTYPKSTFPFISKSARTFIVPIYPEYHTELFPDSILRTESPSEFIENQPYRNAISKVYVSRSYEKNLQKGDLIVFYRTGGYHYSVVSTIGIVDDVITQISDEGHFIELCRKRSVFSNEELKKMWNFNAKNHPFLVNFLYAVSFPKRPNLKRLIELGVINSVNDAPRGFTRITKENLAEILKEANVDESIIVS
jgi:predicted nucleic acid-binding protein